MSPTSTHRRSAFRTPKITEILWALGIIAVLVAILFPVFARNPYGNGNGSCMSNLKQIGLAISEYEEDYDHNLPPPSIPRSTATRDALGNEFHVRGHYPDAITKSPFVVWIELLDPYVQTAWVYQCTEVPPSKNHDAQFSYLYSDLLYNASTHDLTGPSHTVLVMDGEIDPFNIGHAYTPSADPELATFGHNETVIAGYGATVREAATRHNGYANYLLADGHVKSFKPSDVFFQPRANMSPSHLGPNKTAIAPDPAGDMTFNNHHYLATFQLR